MLTKTNQDLDLTIINSDFLNGLKSEKANKCFTIHKIEEVGIGKVKPTTD